jgi:alkylhydroperoxidase/carboxymuconolactone decarboxylase family protein YurZ
VSAQTEFEEMLQELAAGEGPVMAALARLNTGALSQPDLDERTAVAARIGALVALDASPASYLAHIVLADKVGMTPETMKSILITLAPLVGSARVVSAADHLMRAVRQAA